MPRKSLDDIRKEAERDYQRSHSVGGPNLDAMRAARSRMGVSGAAGDRRWTFIESSGVDDIILNFGTNCGRKLSELAEQRDDRSYLAWMLTEGFPGDVLDIVQYWLDKA